MCNVNCDRSFKFKVKKDLQSLPVALTLSSEKVLVSRPVPVKAQFLGHTSGPQHDSISYWDDIVSEA